MHWTQNYIGIPFSNMNCGELAVCIQNEVFHRDLKPLHLDNERNPFSYSRMVNENIIVYLDSKIEEPTEGCCVLMKAMNRLSHVGIYTKIKGKHYVIHSIDSFKSSVLHPIQRLTMYGYEVEGFYSWK